MSKQDDKQTLGPLGSDLLRLMGAILGGTIAYIITRNLPGVGSAFACTVTIALSSFASTRLSRPTLWWTNLGAIAGSIIGTGFVLEASIAQSGLPGKVAARYTIIGLLSIAGFISGIFLGRTLPKAHIPPPKDLLKVASGLTAGVFAIIVTIEFTLQGLEPARTLSSRLSAATTILVTSLAVPGWIGYRLGHLLLVTKDQLSSRRGGR